MHLPRNPVEPEAEEDERRQTEEVSERLEAFRRQAEHGTGGRGHDAAHSF